MIPSATQLKAGLSTALLVLAVTLLLLCLPSRAAEAPTNDLAIYLVTDKPPLDAGIAQGKTNPQELKLSTEPLISDRDFLSYNTNEHYFAVKAEAAKRVSAPYPLYRAFVLVASGERIYVGLFSDLGSSRLFDVPTIVRVPSGGLREFQGLLPASTFSICRGVPLDGTNSSRGADGKTMWRDVRNDPRILAAIKKLGL